MAIKIWKCPVCGFKAQDENKLDEHIKKTGHLIYNDTEDKGKETPREPSDLEYTKHTGYTPGVSSGDVQSDETDKQSKKRVESEEKKAKND